MQFCSFLNLQSTSSTAHQICPIASLLFTRLLKKKSKAWYCHYLCSKDRRLLQVSLYYQYLKLFFFLLSFKLRSFLPTPCLRQLSHRRPSLAQQCSKKGIMIDSPWCKLEYCSPITSPSRSSNETSHWDRSYWISICVSLAVGGYCLSKHWFVLLSFLLFNTCWCLVKSKENCSIKRLVFSTSCDVNW